MERDGLAPNPRATMSEGSAQRSRRRQQSKKTVRREDNDSVIVDISGFRGRIVFESEVRPNPQGADATKPAPADNAERRFGKLSKPMLVAGVVVGFVVLGASIALPDRVRTATAFLGELARIFVAVLK